MGGSLLRETELNRVKSGQNSCKGECGGPPYGNDSHECVKFRHFLGQQKKGQKWQI